MKIPFKFLPASWGLKGEAREIAEANYYLDGEELARKLAEIKYSEDKDTLLKIINQIDLKYGKIDKFEYELIELGFQNLSQDEFQLAELELKYKFKQITEDEYTQQMLIIEYGGDSLAKELYALKQEFLAGNITKTDYELQQATLKQEPYLGIPESQYNPAMGLGGFKVEFIWNDYFVEYLKANGYSGQSGDHIVDQYLYDLWVENAPEFVKNSGTINPSRIVR